MKLIEKYNFTHYFVLLPVKSKRKLRFFRFGFFLIFKRILIQLGWVIGFYYKVEQDDLNSIFDRLN